jgi:hypothetical protein
LWLHRLLSLRKIFFMATSNSSNGGEVEPERISAGQRTGEGAQSVLPYLHDSLATKPGELFAADQDAEPKRVRSLAGRVRKVLQNIKIAKRTRRSPR